MPDHGPQLKHLQHDLGRVGRVVRRQPLYTGVLAVLGMFQAGFLGGFLLDYLARFPYPLRLLFLFGGVGFCVWHFRRRYLAAYRRRLTPQRVSLMVEDAHPTLQSRLISSLQLGGAGARLPVGASADLVDGLCRQTFHQVREIDFFRVVERAWARRELPLAGVGLLLVFLCCLLLPAYTTAYAKRLLLPGVRYPTRTKIRSLELPLRIPAGDPIVVRVLAAGVLPELGVVEVRNRQGRVAKFDLLPKEGAAGEYECEVEPITEKVRMTVYLGDAERGPRVLTPVQRPGIKVIRFRVEPPAYTVSRPEQARKLEQGGNLRVIQGSDLVMEVEASKPLTLMKLEIKSGEVKIPPLRLADKGKNLYSTSFKARAGFSYTFAMVDREDLAAKDLPIYRLSVIRDRAPLIRIEKPRGAAEAAPVSRVPLRFQVRDDFRVGRVRILYQVFKAEDLEAGVEGEDRQPPSRVYAEIGDVGKAKYVFDGIWDNNKIHPLPGQALRIWVEATDTAEPEAHTSISTEVMLRVLSAEEYRVLLLERLGEQKQAIGERIIEIKESHRQLRKLAK